jgi:hypothetical protein
LHALRYFPFSKSADNLISKLLESGDLAKIEAQDSANSKTSLHLVLNRSFLEKQIEPPSSYGEIIFRYFLKYYGNCLYHARPLDENANDIGLSLFLSDNKSDVKSIFPFIEQNELNYFLNEWNGSADVSRNRSEIMSQKYKNPLDKDALKTYCYFFSGEKIIDSIPAYEISFFSRQPYTNACEGYIYLSKKDSSYIKSVFTLNYLTKKGLSNDILFTRSLSNNEDYIFMGDNTKLGIVLKRQTSMDTFPLLPTEQSMPEFINTLSASQAYRNLIRTVFFLYNQKIGIAGDKFELGSFMQTLSYNDLEGVRLRLGANTTAMLNKYFRLDGYIAYGLKDRKLKYRSDIVFPFSHTDKLTVAYVEDLNVPGRNQLDYNRDRIYKSMNKAEGDYLSLQKIGQIKLEKSISKDISFTVTAKHLYDKPQGYLNYKIGTTVIQSLTNFETGITLRFAPGEKFVTVRDNRFVFRKADIDIRLNQRFGLKGIMGSEYSYKATDFSISKLFQMPSYSGTLDVRIYGGKFWDRAPFPLLFFPVGSRNSFLFESGEYNLIDLYENLTDRFIATTTNLSLNWSPVNLFYSKSKIQTNIGIKAHYGPLSNSNKPELHSELFDFQGIVSPLGTKPYLEGNIGIGNILRIIRIDFVHRFGSKNRNAILFSAGFSL